MDSNKKADRVFEDVRINVKIKLSALWASLIALYIYGDYFELYVPGRVKKLINVTSQLDSPTTLFIASILIAIPALMIALSILLKPEINRMLNIIFGIVLTAVVILVGSTSFYKWYSFYVLYAYMEAIVTISIIWIAWKWPKESAA